MWRIVSGRAAGRGPAPITFNSAKLASRTSDTSVTRRVIDHFVGRSVVASAPHPQLHHLTEREREIMSWVATGRSNDEIAAELVVSPATVRTHVSRAMVKLGARDRAQLVVFAVQSGLTR
jgi:DNA-binding NarL/FixJ family response regulator